MDQEHVRALTQELGEELKGKFGGNYRWEGDMVHYKYRGVDAKVSFNEATLHVDVKLGLLMAALKGMIESEVNKYLDKHVV